MHYNLTKPSVNTAKNLVETVANVTYGFTVTYPFSARVVRIETINRLRYTISPPIHWEYITRKETYERITDF